MNVRTYKGYPYKWYTYGLVIILAMLLVGCGSITITTNGGSNSPGSGFGNGSSNGSSGNNSSSSGANSQAPNWGQQSKTSGCHAIGGLQDKACTPGDIFPTATASTICVSGYTKTVRNVSVSTKNQVYASYGITHHSTGQYEVDHLVPLELGGSNDISNLWPEAASPQPGFHQKDVVENYLHDQVCSRKMDLRTAQAEIANDWLAVYHQIPSDYSSGYPGN